MYSFKEGYPETVLFEVKITNPSDPIVRGICLFSDNYRRLSRSELKMLYTAEGFFSSHTVGRSRRTAEKMPAHARRDYRQLIAVSLPVSVYHNVDKAVMLCAETLVILCVEVCGRMCASAEVALPWGKVVEGKLGIACAVMPEVIA